MAIRNPNYQSDRSDLTERVVSLNRVAKVVKGGRKFSFSALIVVGDQNGRVGAGLGKAREVPEAIRKGVEVAKRSMITVPMVGTTIPHEVRYKWGAAKILLKPAAPGTGVISGGAMRAVIELAGIKDILTKSLGTNNPINTVRATIEALQAMRTAQEVAELRGKTVEDIVGRRLAQAYRTAESKGTVEAAPELAAKGQEIKVLGAGRLGRKLTVEAHAFSAPSRAAIETKGGSVKVLGEPKKAKKVEKKEAPKAEVQEPDEAPPPADAGTSPSSGEET